MNFIMTRNPFNHKGYSNCHIEIIERSDMVNHKNKLFDICFKQCDEMATNTEVFTQPKLISRHQAIDTI